MNVSGSFVSLCGITLDVADFSSNVKIMHAISQIYFTSASATSLVAPPSPPSSLAYRVDSCGGTPSE